MKGHLLTKFQNIPWEDGCTTFDLAFSNENKFASEPVIGFPSNFKSMELYVSSTWRFSAEACRPQEHVTNVIQCNYAVTLCIWAKTGDAVVIQDDNSHRGHR